MNRRGIALPTALLALLISSALAAAALATARLRWLSGSRQLAAAAAQASAAGAVDWRTADWDYRIAESLPIGAMIGFSGAVAALPTDLRTHDSLFRLSHGVFLVRSVAERVDVDGRVLARDDVGRIVQALAHRIPDSAAVIAAGVISVGPNAAIDGADHILPGLEDVCPSASSMGTAAVTDSALASHLDSIGLRDLLGAADLRLGGALVPGPVIAADGRCDEGAPANWGDPRGGACSDRLPVVILDSASRVSGGEGQGILLALGPVELSGNSLFAGAMMALGPVLITERARVYGTILGVERVTVADSGRIERSTCAIRRALSGVARPKPVLRGWARFP
jgi:hypothetical protein